MALFNEILVGRYNGILHKLLNMKEGAPAPTLSSDIGASICLEDDRPEWQFLGGEWRGNGLVTRAADAGNFSFMGLFNGQNTGVLGIVEEIWINNATAAAAAYTIRTGVTTALGTNTRGVATDLRWLGKGSTLILGSNIEAAPTGTSLGRVDVAANSFLRIPFFFIMPPTDITPTPSNLVVEGNLINTGVQVTFLWREHAMEQSERR